MPRLPGAAQAVDAASKHRAGELANTLGEGVEALDPFLSLFIPQLFLAIFIPLAILVSVYSVDPLSAAVLFLTAPLIPVFAALISDQAGKASSRQWRSLSRLSAYFFEMLRGLETLKTLARSRDQAQAVDQAGESFRQATMKVLRVTFLSAFALELAATISTAVVAVQVGLRLLYGQIAFEQAFFVLLLAPEFYLPLRSLGARFHAAISASSAAGRVFEILDGPGSSDPKPSCGRDDPPVRLPSAPLSIEFQGVEFAHPDQRGALREVSFSISAGEMVSIIGSSGAGKSTLAALLLGFIQPSSGEITVNGIPLQEIPPGWWLEQVAWVPQFPYLVNGSIAENIRFGRQGVSIQDITSAAAQAQAHQFIQSLPAGYETPIGELGARLSAGQAQRLALARALLKKAPLLILDEPTSQLDAITEDELMSTLAGLPPETACLLITHRSAAAVRASQRLAIQDQRLVQLETPSPSPADEPPEWAQPSPEESPAAARAGLGQSGFAAQIEFASPEIPVESFRKTLVQLLQFLRPYRLQIALSALLGFGAVAGAAGLIGAAAYIIAAAALTSSIADLQLAIVAVRFFGIARAVLRYLERLTAHSLTFHLLADLRSWFYRAIEPLAPAALSRYRTGDLLHRAIADIAALEPFYVRAIAPPFTALLTAAAGCTFLAFFDLRLALALAGFLILAGAVLPLILHQAGKVPSRQEAASRALLSQQIIDTLQGLPDLAVFGQLEHRRQQAFQGSKALARAQNKIAGVAGLESFGLLLSANYALLAVIVLAVPLVNAGDLPGVYLPVLALVSLALFEAITPLPAAADRLAGSLEAAGRIFTLADAPQPVADPQAPIPLPASFSLEVEDLTFSYPSSSSRQVPTAPALQELSFCLPAGGRLALVGPSGSGKSTLVRLLLRFWDYQGQNCRGSIRLAGRELALYHPEDIRRALGVVPQNGYIFAGTIRDNLRLAQPAASQAEIEQAAQMAGLTGFISNLPDGWDTWVGEGGASLSGGERQHLLIARALLKNPSFLILDEATAHLDPESERALWSSLQGWLAGRALLTISHRLTGLERMDEILVMQTGRIVERGRLDELIEKRGLFYRMWSVQAVKAPLR
jgi:ATP-binding cassette, subfamily C, bacterial CydCD